MNFIGDERGNALLEFAIFLPLLVLVVIGFVDCGLLIQQAMQVQEAATAGASFGAIPGNEGNLTGVTTAAKNAAPNLTGLQVTAANKWTCSAGGTSVSSTSTCSGGVTPYKYVTVATSYTASSLFLFPGITSSIALNGYSNFRVPWSP